MRILVVGAHPDDEVIGCGGTIAKYISQGHDVYVFILTQAYYSKERGWDENYYKRQIEWQKQVDEFLHIKERVRRIYPTIHLNMIPHGEIATDIQKEVERIKPDIVFTHYEGDLNMDHVIVSKATQVACRPEPQKGGFKWKIKLLCYEIIGNTPNSFNPNYYEILSKNSIKAKITALSFYQSEAIKPRHHKDKIDRLAKKRADEILVNYAEAFYIIREVNS